MAVPGVIDMHKAQLNEGDLSKGQAIIIYPFYRVSAIIPKLFSYLAPVIYRMRHASHALRLNKSASSDNLCMCSRIFHP